VSTEIEADRTQSEAEAARLSVALGGVSRCIRRQHSLRLGHGGISGLATISREGPLRAFDVAAREVSPALEPLASDQ
jgi:hypothetical protein